MFKYVILLMVVAAVVQSLPTPTSTPGKPTNDPEVRVIKNYNENNGDGSYKWGYEVSNGIKQEQNSYIKNRGTDQEIRVVTGSYSYPLEDGRILTVNYISDENGYQPTITYSR